MLATRLRDALASTVASPVPFRSDMADLSAIAGTPAAVLIAITDRAAPGIILTQRPETMRRHPGQVAFPGGRIDPDDADAVAAALREAEEEIGLPRADVCVVGQLALYRTVTGFDITPIVSVIAPDLPLIACDREVAAVFEVPVAFLFDPANHVARNAAIDGQTRQYIEIIWGERRIWGATAAMIANLAARLT